MSGFYVIFDYFKEAFHLNRDNKVLYKPQIVLILLRSLAMLLMGVYLYAWITKPERLYAINNGEYGTLLAGIGIFVILLVIIVLVLWILSIMVEAGLLNMYKKGVLEGAANMDIFWQGVSKYFFQLILGYLLIMVGTFVFMLAFIIISVATLGVGFFLMIMFSALIALAVQLFLSMWKVSMVMDDRGVIEGFKDSFKFVKNNIWPFLILQIIHWSFSGASRGGSSFRIPSSNSNGGNGNFNIIPREGRDMLPNKDEMVNTLSKYLKIGIAVAVPAVTIASVAASLISMIFEVFFNLSLFIAYKYKFTQPVKQEEVTL